MSTDWAFESALNLSLLMYRSLPHAGTGETPAFALFGVDVRPLCAGDWRTAPFPVEQDRLRYLLMARQELQERALARSRLLAAEYEGSRKDVRLEVGQLVLVRRRRPQDKLAPGWSLPYRVTHVNGCGTEATLCHLLTGRVRPAVHIQNCRILNLPVSPEQAEEWELLLSRAEDEDFRRKIHLSSAPSLRGETDAPEPRTLQHQSAEIIDLESDDDGQAN
jgi:hypothetical protein